MRLTVYLGAEEIRSCADLLDTDSHQGRGSRLRTLEPTIDLAFDCLLAWQQQRQQPPEWTKYLAAGFDLGTPESSVSTSAALAARVGDRVFGVTFGHGRHLLRTERCVHDFGLRVTANTVTPDSLRRVERQGVDHGGRRQFVRTGLRSRLGAFDVDLGPNWVSTLGGETDDSVAYGMTGSQSLQLQLPVEFSELKRLPPVLEHLLRQYSATTYQDHFDFIDLLQPATPDQSAELDRWLADSVTNRRFDRIGIGLPHALAEIDESAIHWYRPQGLRGVDPRRPEDLTLSWLSSLLYRGGPSALDRVRLVAEDAHRVRLSGRPLREYLVAEHDLAGRRFVLSLGRWFAVADRLFTEVEHRLNQIDDLTDLLRLPPWDAALGEDEYCIRTAAESAGRWVSLDRRTFTAVPGHGSIEICDLLDERRHLVCVKKLRRSSTLSHLFSQGSVSATLFGRHTQYRDAVHAAHAREWPGSGHHDATPTIVYAVGVPASHPARNVREALPFFSRVNLANHAPKVIASGLRLGLARIPIVGEPPSRLDRPPGSLPRPRRSSRRVPRDQLALPLE